MASLEACETPPFDGCFIMLAEHQSWKGRMDGRGSDEPAPCEYRSAETTKVLLLGTLSTEQALIQVRGGKEALVRRG